MSGFFDLVGYEYKKIFKRKSAAISLCLMVALIVAMPFIMMGGNVYVDGGVIETASEAMEKDRAFDRALAGRLLDYDLLSEAKAAFSKVPLVERYTISPEFEMYGRPYLGVFELNRGVYGRDYGDEAANGFMQDLSEDELQHFYEIRDANVQNNIENMPVSESIKANLLKLNSQIETPWTFGYSDNFDRLFSMLNTIGVLGAFVIAICLAPIFAGEYGTGMDALILSSHHGKGKAITAKLFTSITFCALSSSIMALLTYMMGMGVYGFDGGELPFQMLIPGSVYPLTLGQAALTLFLCALGGAFIITSLTIFLSSKLKSPFPSIIVICVLVFVPMMLHVSEKTPNLFRLFLLLPTNMSTALIYSHFQYEVFGLPIAPFNFLPVFAVLITTVALFLAFSAFRRHQVG